VTLLRRTHVPLPSQWSLVQRFPSASHGVLSGGSGRFSHMPVEGLHCWPASQGGTGPGQVTLLRFTHVPLPSQWSLVQRLPSASHGVLSGASGTGSQRPVPGLQTEPPSQGGFGG
jgi:hypothetical protein